MAQRRDLRVGGTEVYYAQGIRTLLMTQCRTIYSKGTHTSPSHSGLEGITQPSAAHKPPKQYGIDWPGAVQANKGISPCVRPNLGGNFESRQERYGRAFCSIGKM